MRRCILHCSKIFQEWPLVKEVSVSYLAPSLRLPDLPPQKPTRPSLLYRIARRWRNYWNPPVEGNLCYCVISWITTWR